MLQIALCDDETEELEHARALIEGWLRQRPELDGSLRAFQSGYDLMECVRARGGFDLYLLDVLMPERDGIALGRALRETDRQAAIVYLTSSPDFAVESYSVQALYYLLKPFGEAELYPVLNRFAAGYLQERADTLPVRTHDGVTPVRMARLVSAELRGRAVYCRLAEGGEVVSQTLRGSFDQFAAPLLGDRRFLKVGASFVINLSFVEGLTGREFLMRDGSRVPVPRASMAALRDAYMSYLFERGRG